MSDKIRTGFVKLIITVEDGTSVTRDHIEITQHAYDTFARSVGGWGVTNLLVNGIKDMMDGAQLTDRSVDFGKMADEARAEIDRPL